MLDIRGASPGLLDDPLLLEVGGAPPKATLVWRARLRDDDGFVWRAAAPTPEGLLTAWVPAKPTAGPVAALRSLRPVDVDVRVENTDGAASNRTVTRRLLNDGVRARRWKDAVAGTLYLPATQDATAALVIDAREPKTAQVGRSPDAADSAPDSPRAGITGAAGSPPHSLGPDTPGAIATSAAIAEPAVEAGLDAAPLAAALLASRGVLTFVLTDGKGDPLAAAQERLAQVPGSPARIETLSAAGVGVPPGVGFRGEDQRTAEQRGAAWDTLLQRLGARPRATR
jgi:hypothetical protein